MEIVTLAQRPELHDAIDAMPKSWPTFMYKDPVARLMGRLPTSFPELQFAALDGDEVVGIVIAAAFAWDGDPASLPDRGWDAILEQVFRDEDDGRTPTAATLLEAAVHPARHEDRADVHDDQWHARGVARLDRPAVRRLR